MELRFSVVTSDRQFAKAIRRIRPRFAVLLESFARIELVNPTHQAILVGITNDKPPEFFEEVSNDEGFFQILAGVRFASSDAILEREVFKILRRATNACPFSIPDHLTIQTIFDSAAASLLSE